MSAISNHLRAVVAGSGQSAFELNHGTCEEIAEGVAWRFPEVEIIRTGIWDTSLPVHAWIKVGGRHYDVEAPDGVDDPYDLPIFKRARREREGGC